MYGVVSFRRFHSSLWRSLLPVSEHTRPSHPLSTGVDFVKVCDLMQSTHCNQQINCLTFLQFKTVQNSFWTVMIQEEEHFGCFLRIGGLVDSFCIQRHKHRVLTEYNSEHTVFQYGWARQGLKYYNCIVKPAFNDTPFLRCLISQ